MSRRLKNTIFTSVTLIAFLCLLEGLARLIVAAYSGDASALRYGLDERIKVRSQNRIITFYKIQRGEGKAPQPKDARDRKPERVITIAAFGGSTTRGYNCSSAASSWPEELGKILNSETSYKGSRFKVLNFGADGTNSDYAVEQLPLANADRTLNFVLWANFVNESDILFTGPKRNLETLAKMYPDILGDQRGSFSRNRLKVLLHRVDRTLEKYSLFYWSFQKTIQFLKVRFPGKVDNRPLVEDWMQTDKAERYISLALENYRINFLKARGYCEEKGLTLIMVRLPLQMRGDQTVITDPLTSFANAFRKALDTLMENLSREHHTPLINVHELYARDRVPDDVFCDGAHQRLEGHRLTGRYIAEALRSLFSRSAGAN